MCRKPPTAFEWAHFFVTFLLRNKKVNKRSFKETCFFGSASVTRQEMNKKKDLFQFIFYVNRDYLFCP